MGDFSTNSFPLERWSDSDTLATLDTMIASIDAAIRHTFGFSVNELTAPFDIADDGSIVVQTSIAIGTSNAMIDVVDSIPASTGANEDQKLAHVEAIRNFLDVQRLPATNIDVNTSLFDGLLSSDDDTVQKALDTLDDIDLEDFESQLENYVLVDGSREMTGSLDVVVTGSTGTLTGDQLVFDGGGTYRTRIFDGTDYSSLENYSVSTIDSIRINRGARPTYYRSSGGPPSETDLVIDTDLDAYLLLAGGTMTGNLSMGSGNVLATDTVNEYTTDAGVTAGGVLLDDGQIWLGNSASLKGRETGGTYRDILYVTVNDHMFVGDIYLPIYLKGSATRPDYNGGDLALFTDIGTAVAGYLPLAAGSGSPLTGDLFIDTAATPRITLTESGSLTRYGYIEDEGSVFRLGGVGTGTRQVDIVTGATSPGDAFVTMFLATNTTGNSIFSIMRGDGTGIWRHRFYGNTGDVNLCQGAGDLTVNGTSVSLTGHTHVEADITDLGTYLPLTAGSGKPLSGDLYLSASGGAIYIEDSLAVDQVVMEIPGGGPQLNFGNTNIDSYYFTNVEHHFDKQVTIEEGNLYLDKTVSPTIFLRENADAASYLSVSDRSTTLSRIDKITESGEPIITINPTPSDGTSGSTIALFRYTDSTGEPKFQILQGDATATVQHNFDGKSGDVTLCQQSGDLTIGGTTNVNPSIYLVDGTDDATIQYTGSELYLDFHRASGQPSMYIDPLPDDGTSSARVRLFRLTNTTGNSSFTVHTGDGTNTDQHTMYAQGDAYFCQQGGSVTIGEGDLYLDKTANPTIFLREAGDTANYSYFQDTSDGVMTIGKVNTAGATYLDFQVQPTDGTSTAYIRIFRGANTTGGAVVNIFPGDGTTTANHSLWGSGDADFCKVAGTLTVGDSTDKITLDRDGIYLVGTATMWEDLRVPITSTKSGGSKDPDFAQFKDNGSGSQGVFVEWFSPSVEEELYFNAQLPHGWKEGSDIEVHVHWVSADTAATSGTDVCWGLEYTWSNINGTFGNTAIIYGDEQSNGSTETITVDKHYLTEIGTISSTGKTMSSMLVCRVFRDATGAGGTDDYDDDAGLLEVDFHYQVDSLGSKEEYVKGP